MLSLWYYEIFVELLDNFVFYLDKIITFSANKDNQLLIWRSRYPQLVGRPQSGSPKLVNSGI